MKHSELNVGDLLLWASGSMRCTVLRVSQVFEKPTGYQIVAKGIDVATGYRHHIYLEALHQYEPVISHEQFE
jgi:hypothetical protein